jgi:hypothetical protein
MTRPFPTVVVGLLMVSAALAPACSRIAEPDAVTEITEPEVAQEPDLSPLTDAFAGQGVHVDTGKQQIRIDAAICQRVEPLEYLLVLQPQGKDHEAMFSCTEVSAEALNAAMLLLGVEKGVNGEFTATEPAPTVEEVQAGVAPYSYTPAHGDGFYIYVQWQREIDGRQETFRYRAEDLVLNIRDETTYQRGRWVYLGSRFVRPHKDAEEFFAAQGEGNLVSLVNFSPANHLLAGGDPSADNQSIWYPNVYMLPPIGYPVEIIFSRQPLGDGPE